MYDQHCCSNQVVRGVVVAVFLCKQILGFRSKCPIHEVVQGREGTKKRRENQKGEDQALIKNISLV